MPTEIKTDPLFESKLDKSLLTRRQFLAGAGVLAAGAAVTGGSSWAASDNFVVEHHEFRLKRLPAALDGITLAQISDIHFNTYLGADYLNRVVATINELQPDLVVITGDFVTGSGPREQSLQDVRECAQVLAGLTPAIATVGILGNHDHDVGAGAMTTTLATGAVRVLRNQSIPVERAGARLWLCGLDSATRGRPDVAVTISGIPRQDCKIVLVHEPDYADVVARFPVDLQLSGHSHGGQIRLPFIGPLILPRLAYKYTKGRYRVRELTVYTNRGIGVIGVPMRMLCPPEITFVTLRAG